MKSWNDNCWIRCKRMMILEIKGLKKQLTVLSNFQEAINIINCYEDIIITKSKTKSNMVFSKQGELFKMSKDAEKSFW